MRHRFSIGAVVLVAATLAAGVALAGGAGSVRSS